MKKKIHKLPAQCRLYVVIWPFFFGVVMMVSTGQLLQRLRLLPSSAECAPPSTTGADWITAAANCTLPRPLLPPPNRTP